MSPTDSGLGQDPVAAVVADLVRTPLEGAVSAEHDPTLCKPA
jgi:hypothetical protein